MRTASCRFPPHGSATARSASARRSCCSTSCRSTGPAAACSFAVAVTNNYTLNRFWTFRGDRGHFAYQGLRFLLVSLVALGANLVCLRLLVAVGLGKVVAQAVAIMLVTPLNFVGNKLW